MALFRGEGAGSLPTREFVSLIVSSAPPAAGGYWAFVADQNYNVTAVREIHSVVGGASYAVAIRKIQVDGTAPSAAAGANVIELLSSPISLISTVNTLQVVSPAVSVVAKGDRLAFNFTGTNTGYVGEIQVELQAA